jgi:hypothetical protein
VLSVKRVKLGKIFALASVEIDIDGVLLVIHGVRAISRSFRLCEHARH